MKRWVARLAAMMGAALLAGGAAAEELKVNESLSLDMPPLAEQCRLEPGKHDYDSGIFGYAQGSLGRNSYKLLAVYESCDGLAERRRNSAYPSAPSRYFDVVLEMWEGAPADWGDELAAYDAAAAYDVPLLEPNAIEELRRLIRGYTHPFSMGVGMPENDVLASLWQAEQGYSIASISGMQQPVGGSHFMAHVTTALNVDGYIVTVTGTSPDFSPAAYYDLLAETLEAASAIKVIRPEDREPPATPPAPARSPL